MFSGVSSRINSPNAESSDIPEWKRLLIMKKRAALPSAIGEESDADNQQQTCSSFRGPVSSAECGGIRTTSCSGICDNLPVGHTKFSMIRTAADCAESEKPTLIAPLPAETVIRTIGNIKIELRSVYKVDNTGEDRGCVDRFLTSPLSEPAYPDSAEEEEEDLQYGPGIVDKLRSKFLNLGVKSKRKPVVRKFSSLENLSGGMFRSGGVHNRADKKLGGRLTASGNINQRIFPCLNFKKAQSMETLLVGGAVDSNRRARIFPSRQCRNQNEKQSTPVSRFNDTACKFEYNRQISASNINENELPKPDTVKHFKRIFESPTADLSCRVPVNQAIYENRTAPIASHISNSTSGKKHALPSTLGNTFDENDELTAKESAIEESSVVTLLSIDAEESHVVEPNELSPVEEINVPLSPKRRNSSEINCSESVSASSPASSISDEAPTLLETDVNKESAKFAEIQSPDASEIEDYPVVKVNPEQLPLLIESPCSNSDLESPQGSQVSDEPERSEEDEENCVTSRPHLDEEGDFSSPAADMVIACSGEDGRSNTAELLKQTLRKPSWQKPPPPTTSIVFDFRGKDVKPHISLNPAPFGCRPAKVKKRAGSPPRGESVAINGDHSPSSEEEDDEEWDEMDIGADLPAISGIVFIGENIVAGKSSFLDKRNKKLSIQFNDDAASTYEYPCESPPPFEENGHDYPTIGTDSNLRPVKSSFAINNTSANSALSNYTPHVLNYSDEFQLGVLPPPPPIHRRTTSERKFENPEMSPEEILPADPEDSSGWSATETADILF